jgi:hypothetical protein
VQLAIPVRIGVAVVLAAPACDNRLALRYGLVLQPEFMERLVVIAPWSIGAIAARCRGALKRPWTKTDQILQQEAARPIQELPMETQNGNPG